MRVAANEGRLTRGMGFALVISTMACGHPPASPTGPVYMAGGHKVVVLPADSTVFPKAAMKATEALGRTRVKGLDPPEMSKVSLEVVQLSIECVEPTDACYEAVGKSLSANQLLFAQFEAGPKPDQVRVIVTLFDVDTAGLKKRARKLYDTELDAVYGLRDVVEEATRP